MSTKPRPLSTSRSNPWRAGPSGGSGKSSLQIDVRSIDDSASFLVALSTSAISASERRSFQSVLFFRSAPYHAERPLISGGNEGPGFEKSVPEVITLSNTYCLKAVLLQNGALARPLGRAHFGAIQS